MFEGWKKDCVADLCKRVSVGIVIKPSQYYVDPESGIRAFRSMNIGEGKVLDKEWVYISHEGHEKNSKSRLQKGDVLVVRTGAPGTACVLPSAYEGSNCIDIVFARPDQSRILPEYLAALTNSVVGRRHVDGNTSGLAQKHFNVGAYKELIVSYPPLHEQRKIAEILQTWDESIEKFEALRSAKKCKLDGLAANLIFDPQVERQHLRNFLREAAVRNSGQQTERVLSVTNSEGFMLAEEQFAHRVASADLSNYKIVRRGQYAYNPSRINVGSIARLDEWDDGVLSPMYLVFEVSKGLDSDFFGHWLRSGEARQRIRLATQGSVRETVNFSDLGSIEIPVPTLHRQRDISKFLNAAQDELRLIDHEIGALSRQKRGLMQKLLTGEWRVNV